MSVDDDLADNLHEIVGIIATGVFTFVIYSKLAIETAANNELARLFLLADNYVFRFHRFTICKLAASAADDKVSFACPVDR